MPKFDFSINAAWMFLIIAGLIEVGWAISMKYTDGFTRLWPTVITFSGMIVSFALLSLALTKIPISVSYAIWTGIGAAGTAIIGMYFLGEPRSALKLACVFMIVGGVVGLKLSGSGMEDEIKKEQGIADGANKPQ
jgi:quaternary ammonium compound-resistance protein SugE